jgi:hypothetical protein
MRIARRREDGHFADFRRRQHAAEGAVVVFAIRGAGVPGGATRQQTHKNLAAREQRQLFVMSVINQIIFVAITCKSWLLLNDLLLFHVINLLQSEINECWKGIVDANGLKFLDKLGGQRLHQNYQLNQQTKCAIKTIKMQIVRLQ